MLNGLDLFSGIGGLTIALEPWVTPVAYCEIDRYAQSVLLSRMATGELPRGPIWDDITSLNGSMLPGIDIIYGGFPCQDISTAGTNAGMEGERSGLFKEVMRLAKEIQPQFIFIENVSAIRSRGASQIIQEMAALGFDARWGCISAYDVGSPHLRSRWFCLAADTKKLGCLSGMEFKKQARESFFTVVPWGDSKATISRKHDGIPFRVDRARTLGNAVVPAQAREAFKRLIGLK